MPTCEISYMLLMAMHFISFIIMNNRRLVEKEVINLSRILQLNEGKIISGFKTCLYKKKIPEKFVPLKHSLEIIPVSLSEGEREFKILWHIHSKQELCSHNSWLLLGSGP
jgi:hypothetical protein